MKLTTAARRLTSMDAAELRFRAACHARNTIDRVRTHVRREAWRRDRLARVLRSGRWPGVDEAIDAARRGDFTAAHQALAAHFAARASCWPLQARRSADLARLVALRFPDAVHHATVRADRIADGCHDLLGYRGLESGTPPDWHRDAASGRRAPSAFWMDVPYLDPSGGDHKVIWELNRHQHWIALGRAFSLTRQTKYYERVVTELESWLAANPPLQGINWASMLELAFRSLSWIWTVEFFAEAAVADDRPWLVDLVVALDRQLRHVARNLSRYFSPNTHLTGEALALYGAGRAMPELADSNAYADLGRRVLLEQAETQIRGDGGHAELSAHYHRYSTDFYLFALLIARTSDDAAAAALESAASRQARYLRAIADDAGRLPLLGDDDGGQLWPVCGRPAADAAPTLALAAAVLGDPSLAVCAPPEETYWILGRAPDVSVIEGARAAWPSQVLPHSGYFVSRTPAGDHLLFDAGPHGFLNGGHAHSDALSIVLTVAGRPVLVDPGTATYTMDAAMRDRFRSTRMHNTVVLDGREHVAPSGPFHWSGGPAGRFTISRTAAGFDFVEGTHDAYAGPAHVRSIVSLHDFGWLIVDHVAGDDDVTAEAWWHLHPSWTPSIRDHVLDLIAHDGQRLGFATTATDVTVIGAGDPSGLSAFAPEYGRVEHGYAVRTVTRGHAPFVIVTFVTAPARRTESLRLSVQPAETSAGDDWRTCVATVRLNQMSIAALLATPVSSDFGPDAAPATRWGGAGVRTDARVAVVRFEQGTAAVASLVNGSQVEIADPRAGLALATRVPAFHGSLRPALASAVHQVEPSERLVTEAL